MTEFEFSNSPPDEWSELCAQSGALFSSGAWQGLLEYSFKCRTIYACNGVEGFAISIFRGGPFSIGYLGFPVGGVVGGTSAMRSLVDILAPTNARAMPICVRIPMSGFDEQGGFDLPYQSNPETVILDLQDWSLGSVSKNLRRDIKKAGRSQLAVVDIDDPAFGVRLFDIYSQTVKRHGGSIRYNQDYFQALIELSSAEPRLRVLVATQESNIAGFAVVVRHRDTAYYLHGGASPEFQKSSPSDLLLNDAIHNAQQAGSLRFSLMASPPNQPTLVRYKEKWGGVTRELRTYTLVLRPTYHLFRVAEKLYSLFR